MCRSNPGEVSLHSVRPGCSHAASHAGHLRRGAAAAARFRQSRTGNASKHLYIHTLQEMCFAVQTLITLTGNVFALIVEK